MKKKRKKQIFRLLIVIFFVAILIKQQIIIVRLNKDIKSCNEALNKVKSQNLQLKEELKISKRIDYIERLARQKLRLIKPGEILFIDKNKKNN
ncbi:FtsB family cell division protein [Thermobrachium celere]|uniref:Cell division protein DivIC (FtsB), stabilizes FtsL against RasP cleavage n=1 Tax=Thermobrachium celere DSM 8682 TaxID=941824 RepID=R7RUM4_9CLOT|nr:septum formation initiator family protein [Thermobrachium celere]CDF59095.1 hypothetical protein TCEL_02163 [Thermobrachium celere DSM 8682]